MVWTIIANTICVDTILMNFHYMSKPKTWQIFNTFPAFSRLLFFKQRYSFDLFSFHYTTKNSSADIYFNMWLNGSRHGTHLMTRSSLIGWEHRPFWCIIPTCCLETPKQKFMPSISFSFWSNSFCCWHCKLELCILPPTSRIPLI